MRKGRGEESGRKKQHEMPAEHMLISTMYTHTHKGILPKCVHCASRLTKCILAHLGIACHIAIV